MKKIYNKIVDAGYKIASKKSPNEYDDFVKADKAYKEAIEAQITLINEFSENVNDAIDDKSNDRNLNREQELALDEEFYKILNHSRTLVNVAENEKGKIFSDLKKEVSSYALNPLIDLNLLAKVVDPHRGNRKDEISYSFNQTISNTYRRIRLMQYQTDLMKNDIAKVKNKYGI